MKNVVMCQLSVMLESGLPGSIDYEKYVRDFFRNINRELISLNFPIPDKNAWNQMPPEIPRVICNSNDIDVRFSGNNALFALKNIHGDWNQELRDMISEVSRIFEDIGHSYMFNYRVGVVLTTQVDSISLRRNVNGLIDNSVSDKSEWQLSFLDKIENGNLRINRWKRFIYNSNENYNQYIIDVNTSPDSRINLRDNTISCVFEILNETLSGAYNEFTE